MSGTLVIPAAQGYLESLCIIFHKCSKTISEHVFVSQAGTKLHARNLLRAFYSARKKSGLDDVRFHDLGHIFATRLVQAGINIYVVKELLWHKTLAMTMRYAHHYPESLRHGVEVLDRSGYALVTVDEKGQQKGVRESP